jgi:signal transduction histidine kinase
MLKSLPDSIRALRSHRARPWVWVTTGAVVAAIWWLDLVTGPGREPGALYDLPIIFVAVATSLAGAIATAGAASLAYALTLAYHHEPLNIADLSQSALFLLVGVTVAKLVTEYLRSDALQTDLLNWNKRLELRVTEAVAAERAAQRRMQDSERLKAMGEASAQIAHEIRNPLAAIGGFARRIEKLIPPEHPARADLSVIIEEVARLELVLRDLLEFARPRRQEVAAIDLRQIVQVVAALARLASPAHDVLVWCREGERAPSALGDADQIKRALLNVALNGLQAMPDGGELKITVSHGLRKCGPTVEVRVQDRGCGIAPDLLPRIFEPFFTTRRGGTGLGLPLVKKTVEAHGGEIEIESDSQAGTSVTVWFPAVAATACEMETALTTNSPEPFTQPERSKVAR